MEIPLFKNLKYYSNNRKKIYKIYISNRIKKNNKN